MRFFNNVKFPYATTQELNLDWIMERIALIPYAVHTPAMAGTELWTVAELIDQKAQEIPKGISVVECGGDADAPDHRAACLIYKIDNDNLIGFCLSMSGDIGVQVLSKNGGEWS